MKPGGSESVDGASPSSLEALENLVDIAELFSDQEWQDVAGWFSAEFCPKFSKNFLSFLQENPATKTEFFTEAVHAKRLLDHAILQIAAAVKRYELPDDAFQAGWEQRIKRAGFFTYLIHYGQRRRGEEQERPYYLHGFEAGGIPIDGGAHEMPDLLNESFVLAGIMHDVFEDAHHKGIGKMLDIPKDFETRKKFINEAKDFIEKKIQPPRTKGMLSVKRLLAILTKARVEGKMNRPLSAARFYGKILHHRGTAMLGKKFLWAMASIGIKIKDRSGNARSGLKPEIAGETVLSLLPATQRLNMWFSMQILVDYLARPVTFEMRRSFEDTHTRFVEEANLLPAFRSDFQKNISEVFGIFLTEGEDYEIIALPLSTQGKTKQEIEEIASSAMYGKNADPETVSAYAKRLQHIICIVPHSTTKDKEKFQIAAETAMKKMFPDSLPSGRFRSRMPLLAKAKRRKGSEKYGDCAYKIFNDFPEFRREVLGDVHATILDCDPAAAKRIQNFAASLFRKVKRFGELWGIVDDFAPTKEGEPQEVSDALRKAIRFTLHNLPAGKNRSQTAVPEFDVKENREAMKNFPDEIKGRIKQLAENTAYMLFSKEKSIQVKINGRPYMTEQHGHETPLLKIPEGANAALAIFLTDPRLLFFSLECRIRSKKGDKDFENSASKVLSDGDTLFLKIKDADMIDEKKVEERLRAVWLNLNMILDALRGRILQNVLTEE